MAETRTTVRTETLTYVGSVEDLRGVAVEEHGPCVCWSCRHGIESDRASVRLANGDTLMHVRAASLQWL